ncbi:MAG: ATP-dependent zinc metalloprotease FtsH [Xanthomonadales bacterium]|nr:ATP-dependent zinc metalloprotease FtsH [Xanthomonadales bacterium]
MKDSPRNTGPYTEIRNTLLWILPILFLMLFWMSRNYVPETPDIPYSDFIALVEADNVTRVEFSGDVIRGELGNPRALGATGQNYSRFRTRIPQGGDPDLLPILRQHRVTVDVLPAEESGQGWRILLSLLPLLLLVYFVWFMSRGVFRGLSGGDPRGIGKLVSTPSRVEERPEVTFADVAGQENAKREVAELIEFLEHPERFRRMGAEVPRGILLMGPPGTGKTLMARALAGEAGVPFFSISGSAFIEVFVGVGAARVRNLFQQAKQSAPSIVFVDELDSIGRTRGTGLGGGHDEREQTLNQILAELDGFDKKESVIVLAATNRPDVLDPALLRPGRFDRHVTLDLPDRKDRLAILQLYAKKSPLHEDVDLEALASGTPGFSGAELKNLVNEAAVKAAERNAEAIQDQDLQEARDKIMLGNVRSLIIQPEERRRLAIHEAGHALVAYSLPNADPLYKVTIIPRGRALGVTHQLPEGERYTLAEDYLRDRLTIMMAGRVAERLFTGSLSSGAEGDIHEATALARAMVTRWGMDPEIGAVDLTQSEAQPFLGMEITRARLFSEHSAEAVDQAIESLVDDAESKASEILEKNLDNLEKLARALEDRESLDAGEVGEILGSGRENLVNFPPRSADGK